MAQVPNSQQKDISHKFTDGVYEIRNAFWVLFTGLFAWIISSSQSIWYPLVENIHPLFILLIALIVSHGVSYYEFMFIDKYINHRWLKHDSGLIKPKTWIMPRHKLFKSYTIALIIFTIGMSLDPQFENPSSLLNTFAKIGSGESGQTQ